MKLSDVTGTFQAICAAIALLVSITSASFLERTFKRGPIPEKNLTYFSFGASIALEQIDKEDGIISVQVNAEGKVLRNLFVELTTLRNSGHAAIVPDDIYENISLSTEAPWRIIAVTNKSDAGQSIAFTWERVSDTQFKALKALINPGDFLAATVYLTRMSDDISEKDPPLIWSARISNLPEIKKQATETFELQQPGFLPVALYLGGNGLLFVLFSFSIYALSYFYLLQANRYDLSMSASRILFYVFACLLSLAAADAGNAYVFGSKIISNAPVENWLNLPWLLMNWLILGFLVFKYIKSK